MAEYVQSPPGGEKTRAGAFASPAGALATGGGLNQSVFSVARIVSAPSANDASPARSLSHLSVGKPETVGVVVDIARSDRTRFPRAHYFGCERSAVNAVFLHTVFTHSHAKGQQRPMRHDVDLTRRAPERAAVGVHAEPDVLARPPSPPNLKACVGHFSRSPGTCDLEASARCASARRAGWPTTRRRPGSPWPAAPPSPQAYRGTG